MRYYTVLYGIIGYYRVLLGLPETEEALHVHAYLTVYGIVV